MLSQTCRYLVKIEKDAKADKLKCHEDFMAWMIDICGSDAQYINPQSSSQLQALLFGGAENTKNKDSPLPMERVIKVL